MKRSPASGQVMPQAPVPRSGGFFIVPYIDCVLSALSGPHLQPAPSCAHLPPASLHRAFCPETFVLASMTDAPLSLRPSAPLRLQRPPLTQLRLFRPSPLHPSNPSIPAIHLSQLSLRPSYPSVPATPADPASPLFQPSSLPRPLSRPAAAGRPARPARQEHPPPVIYRQGASRFVRLATSCRKNRHIPLPATPNLWLICIGAYA